MKRFGGALLAMLLAGAAFAHADQVLAAPAPSAPGFPEEPRPPKGAPNVLIIMTDDVGFGASSTFGGPVPTPTFDALATTGVRFNRFHTTSLCSPTRASLLTGRYPHAVGVGIVTDLATGHPGYNSVMPKSAATVAQVLQANGYRTAMFGKHHNVPVWRHTPAGPFTHMPNELGFDYFYGFVGGETNQFRPDLIENRNPVSAPADDPDYILDKDLADHAIAWLRMQSAQSADRPFLLYYTPGTAHEPLQAPKAWLERFRGKFDSGWDDLRKQTLERQKRLGIVPKDARLAPMARGTPAWSSLSPDQKRLHARQMETYAAALAYCDDQIGRVIAELKRTGQLENTIVIYLQGDNGASSEGGPAGAINLAAKRNGYPQSLAAELRRIDQIGGPESDTILPFGWARAINTPFPREKGVASHLGGIRNGLVVSWPGHTARPEAVRSQFHSVADIAPTIYEVTGISPPASFAGVAQQPLDGVSMAYAFTEPDAKPRRTSQYFEMFGNASFYQDGWLVSSLSKGSGRLDAEPEWELYDLRSDYSQSVDLASRRPDKLRQMIAAFEQEAGRANVLPLQSDRYERVFSRSLRPEPMRAAGRHVLYNSPTRYATPAFPDIKNRSWSLDADVVVSDQPSDGVLVAQGAKQSGWSVVVLDRRPTFLYRLDDAPEALFRLQAEQLTPGPHRISVSFDYDGGGVGKGAKVTLAVDGRVQAEGRMERSAIMGWPEGAGVGRDPGAPVSDDYRAPFLYRDEIKQVAFDLQP